MRLSEIRPEDLEHVQATPAVTETGEIEVELPDGTRGTISPDMQDRAIQDGLRVISQEEKQREVDLEDADDSNLLAAATSGLRGLTAGISDQIIARTGLLSEQKLKDLQDANPYVSTAGEITGTIAPAILSGGTSLGAKALAATPAGLIELAGKKTAQKLTGKFLSQTTSNVVKNAVKLGAGSAVEGSLYGVGKLISEDALGDAEFNAENLLASAGAGALIGGSVGGIFGAGAPLVKKALSDVTDKFATSLKGLRDSEIGFMKYLGADKRHIGAVSKKADLTLKDLNNLAMDIGNGFEDSVDDIIRNGGITKPGSKTLKEAAQTTVDEVEKNNDTVLQASFKMMDNALEQAENNVASRSIIGGDEITGKDLALKVKDKFLGPNSGLDDPFRKDIQDVIKDLEGIKTQTDPATGRVYTQPLTPRELKKQSNIYAKEAKFTKVNPTRRDDVYRYLRGEIESQIDRVLESTGGKEVSESYYKAKKMAEKSFHLSDIIQNGKNKAANNKGFTLTQGLATGIGGTVGGIPGAAIGYAARTAQQEYGDKIVSYALRNIEKASNKGKLGISDAVESFFRKSNTTGKISGRAGIKYLTGEEINEDKEKDIQEKVIQYYREPAEIVDSFVKNNKEIIESAPKTAQALQQRILNAAQFLGSKIPKKDESPFQDTPRSRSEIMKFKNYVEAVENPYKTLENLKHGYLSPEAMEAMKVVYPKMFSAIRDEMAHRLPEFKNISEKQKAEISKILNLSSKKAYSPQGFATLQGVSEQGVKRDMQQQRVSPTPKFNQGNRSETDMQRVSRP